MTAPRSSAPALVARIAALAVLYFLGGKLGLSLAFVNTSTSPIWPPTGIAVAALILFGRDLWPGIAIGAFLVNLTTSGAPIVSAVIAVGNTLEAVIAERLVARYANGPRVFDRARDVILFGLAAGIVAPLVSATIGVGALVVSRLAAASELRTVWMTWWLGDALGAILYAPALMLLWTDRRARRHLRAIEGLLVSVALVMVAAAVFGGSGAGQGNYQLGFLCIPWPSGRRSALGSAKRRLPRWRCPSSPSGPRWSASDRTPAPTRTASCSSRSSSLALSR